MPARRIEITVSEETWAAIESARGTEPRAAWIKAAIEYSLPKPGYFDSPPTAGEMVDLLGLAMTKLQEVVESLQEVADTGTDTV